MDELLKAIDCCGIRNVEFLSGGTNDEKGIYQEDFNCDHSGCYMCYNDSSGRWRRCLCHG